MKKENYHFQEGEVLLINKPLNWTSFDLVNKIRYLIKKNLGIKKIKVGHAGTLDPLATGLVVICVGRKTKEINEMMNDDKIYEAKIRLGAWTPSYDLETEIEKEMPYEHITLSDIESVANDFLGAQEQIPPIYSAKKVGGIRAYKLAREGKKVELKKNNITIYSFDILSYEAPVVHCRIHCSKGSYIRSIANDFGLKLNNLGTLVALERTKSGSFDLANAISVEEFEGIIGERANSNSIC